MNYDPITEQLLTVKDVAAFLSISVRSVWRWTAGGKIPPPIRFSKGAVRWKASEIQKMIDAMPAAVRRTSAS